MPDEDEALSTEVGSPSTQDETDQSQGNDNPGSSSESLNGSGGSSGATEERVPYARLKEKVDEANALKAQLEEYRSWQTAHDLIKQQFGSPDKYNEALEASRRQAEEAEIAEQVKQEAEANGYDEAAANQVFQTKLVKKEFDKTKSEFDKVLLEQKLALARNQYPEMDEDTVLARAKKDGSDVIELARKSHEREVSRAEKIREETIASYNAKKAKDKETIPPERSGGGSPLADKCPDPTVDKKGYLAWWKSRGAPVSI